LCVYFILVFLIAPHINLENFYGGNYRYITSSVMILITSFGFAIIVPNLRDYFDDDIKTLRKVIVIGSLIPLVCYLAWDVVIIGSLPSQGKHGLASLMHSEHTTSDLAQTLSNTIQNTLISSLFNLFTSICMLTAFLGVALCLISFLADGFKMVQRGYPGFILFILTFLPPLLIVIYYPGAYIHALNYAGIFCVILLLLLPACMTLFGRNKFSSPFHVPGGGYSQWLVIISSIILLINAFWEIIGAPT
jgi:tyrosine-specific transport protein